MEKPLRAGGRLRKFLPQQGYSRGTKEVIEPDPGVEEIAQPVSHETRGRFGPESDHDHAEWPLRHRDDDTVPQHGGKVVALALTSKRSKLPSRVHGCAVVHQ